MPRSARKVQADVAAQPASKRTAVEVYRAVRHLASGEITVCRTPARKGVSNALKFKSVSEMRRAMLPNHPTAAVNSIIKELADSGSVEFSVLR